MRGSRFDMDFFTMHRIKISTQNFPYESNLTTFPGFILYYVCIKALEGTTVEANP
jgi:hypothetical protein